MGSLSSLNLQQMHELSLQVVRLSGRQEIQDLVSERIDQLGNRSGADAGRWTRAAGIDWPVAIRSMEGLDRRFVSVALLMERPQRDGCALELSRQPA
jgi:hypothetical protein